VVAGNHHGSQKVVLAGAEHALLENGAGSDDAGDFSLHQPLGLGRVFHLVTDGDRKALFHQQGAVAIQGVVGNARQGYTAHLLTGIFAGEHQFQLAGNGDGILKEGLEKVAHPIQQQRMGILLLELRT
jgi:hypothetical protein